MMPVEKMPDDSISIEEMKQYGYKWGGMLPMREEAAAEVMKSCQIYRLYGDDTEGLVLDAKEIKEHAAKGGIFGVEKADWVAELEKQCQRRMVKNLKRRPENDPNAGNIALVIYAGTLSAGQLSAGSSAGGNGWTPAFHRSLSR